MISTLYAENSMFQLYFGQLYARVPTGRRLEVELGMPRFRPEQVGAGAQSKIKPLGRKLADKAGSNLRRELDAIYKAGTLEP